MQTTATDFKAGNPTRLFETAYYAGASLLGVDLRGYDVSADGQRFLMIKEGASGGQAAATPPASMVVVLNWVAELAARVPPAK